jgi:SnoaL-like polyketide cyclase
VFWPGQPDPTRGVRNHHEEAIEFFTMFPDNHLVNNPYKILIAEGDYTCSVADFTGTFKGAMKGLDGKIIQPTNKKFQSFALLQVGRMAKLPKRDYFMI